MNAKITVIPGDGIGQEVTTEAIRVLDTIQDKYGHGFEYEYGLLGGCAIDENRHRPASRNVRSMRRSDAILFGAAGDRNGRTSLAQSAPNAPSEQFAKS